MSKLSKLKLCLMVLPFVFFLNFGTALGQEGGEGCINVPTITENVEGIEKLLALQWAPGHPPAEIPPGKNAVVKVVGGFPPIQWSVSGNGFSLDKVEEKGVDHARNKLLIASSTACDPATITVTDALKDTETGYVRCTNGKWVKKGDYCGMTGSVSCYSATGGIAYYSLIDGYKRQDQQTRYYGSYNTTPDCGWCDEYYAANQCGAAAGTTTAANCIDADHAGVLPGFLCCDTGYYYCRTAACYKGFIPMPEWNCDGTCEGGKWRVSVGCYCVNDAGGGTPGLQYYEWECP